MLISYNTAIAISKIVEREMEEFLDMPNIVNDITNSKLNNSSVNGVIVYNNCTTSISDKMINTLQELIEIIKVNYK